ncbi:MAG: hypothetical protein LBO64_08685 [Desulfovibrio sp.]|jgi:hypothetical protein|nr:hypothetical protein [Desulfovibrio sp.]
MSHPLSTAGASAYRRLGLFVPKLHQVADWVRKEGESLKSDALNDSIPFTLRCLADEAARIRDDLKPFTEVEHE